MIFDIITIFPKIFDSYFNESIIKRAQAKKLVKINIHNLRDYTEDKHQKVDDRPYGGGFGMVLMVEPILKAVAALRKIKNRSVAKTMERLACQSGNGGHGRRQKLKVILLSAKGKKFDQKMARRFSKLDQLILICGRYEGIDERVAKYIADEEVSVGDYILTGGELPTMIIIDTVTRLIPKVIAKGSLEEESFSREKYIEYPHYTRPESVKIKGRERKVPKILISGNHQKIKEWQEKHSR